MPDSLTQSDSVVLVEALEFSAGGDIPSFSSAGHRRSLQIRGISMREAKGMWRPMTQRGQFTHLSSNSDKLPKWGYQAQIANKTPKSWANSDALKSDRAASYKQLPLDPGYSNLTRRHYGAQTREDGRDSPISSILLGRYPP